MDQTVFEYVSSLLPAVDVPGKSILEAGSYNFNGTVRDLFLALKPAEYIGVDILEGPGVDVVGSAGQLVEVFGENRFDVIVTTEMMEHVEDWQGAVSHMKRTLKPGGYLILTTRSQGVNYHGYPHDYWRYEQEDMRLIFDDMEIIDLVVDRVRPGVFIFCRKPEDFHERPLDQIALYSILTRRRTTAVRPLVKRLVVGWYGLKKGSYHSYIRGRMWLWARFPASLRGWLKRRVFTAPK